MMVDHPEISLQGKGDSKLQLSSRFSLNYVHFMVYLWSFILNLTCSILYVDEEEDVYQLLTVT